MPSPLWPGGDLRGVKAVRGSQGSGLYWMGIYDYLDLGGINAVLVKPQIVEGDHREGDGYV